MIDQYRTRLALLRAAFERNGCLHAISARDPAYAILLTRNASSDAPWRVTSFRGGEPVGHREYDALEGRAPAFNAFHEFMGDDMQLVPHIRSPSTTRARARANSPRRS